MLYAHLYTWSEAVCSLLYMEFSFMYIAIDGVKLCAHCYARSEAICSLLDME